MRLFVQEAAESDILGQIEWYADHGLPHIAQRFPVAVRKSIASLIAMPGAGSQKHIANSQLAGLRSWPVSGFPESQVYYLTSPELLTVVRVLHGKRDIAALLEAQNIEKPPGVTP